MSCGCCSWRKDTEATLNSIEIKPIVLSIVKLYLAGGIVSRVVSQAGIQSVSKFGNTFSLLDPTGALWYTAVRTTYASWVYLSPS